MIELSLHVVGIAHDNPKGKGHRRFEVSISVPGEPVELRPEPKNVADPHAIAVYSCRGIQIGYLTADRAPWIGSMLSNGREISAIFQSVARSGAAIRVAFDGREPTLPPISPPQQTHAFPEGADPDYGFWPDDVSPED